MTEKVRFSRLERYGFGPNVMKKTKVCTNCHHVVRDSAAYCPDCGEKLSIETLFDRYKKHHSCCPHCDTVLAPDSQYCPTCGKQILLKAAGYQEFSSER